MRIRPVLKFHPHEAGPAALAMLLQYYDRPVPLALLSAECGIVLGPVTLESLLQVANRHGLAGEITSVSRQDLDKTPTPFITDWEGEPVLVDKVGANRVDIRDPEAGPRTVLGHKFKAAFGGRVLQLRPRGGQLPGYAADRPMTTWHVLLSWLREAKGGVAYCSALGILLVIPSLAVPALTQVLVDEVIVHRRQGWLLPLVGALVVAAALIGLLRTMQLKYLRRARTALTVRHNALFVWKGLRQPRSLDCLRLAGDLGARIKINAAVANLVATRIAPASIDVITLVAFGFMIRQYDAMLAAISYGFAGATILVLAWLGPKRRAAAQRAELEEGLETGRAVAGVQAIETLKAGAFEGGFISRWGAHFAQSLMTRLQVGRSEQIVGVAPHFLAALGGAILLVVGGFRVMNNLLSLGELIAVGGLFQAFLAPVRRLVELASELFGIAGKIDRLQDLTACVPGPGDPHHRPTRPPFGGMFEGRLEVRDLVFGYLPLQPPILNCGEIRLEPGLRLGLVGNSGAGKSTWVKLVAGILEPWSGEILLDGKPRSELAPADFTRAIAVVQRDALFVPGSLIDALTLWDGAVSEATVARACRDAEIFDTIARRGGFDTVIWEGATNFSVAERQQLGLARALVHDPAVLIVDEALSDIDPGTQSRIDQNLLRRGCTCVFITHDVATLAQCDEIIVLRNGQIVERGTHDELWREGTEYVFRLAADGQGCPR